MSAFSPTPHPPNGSPMQQGLSDTEAKQRLSRDGANELSVSKQQSALRLLAKVVMEPMFLLLVACGGLYLVLGNRNEALMLLGFVFVVIGITFVQERRTARSLAALRELSSPQVLVIRDGIARKIASRELVAGDMVLLAEGDRIAADMSLLEAANLSVDESMLTGESVPVTKSTDAKTNDANTVFAGTLVTQGTAIGHVSATGERSALGKIGKSLAGLGEESTPIQQETRRVVKYVALIGLALAGMLTVAYGVSRGDWLHGLLAGLTFAMAILPEELPVILTLFLGLGAWRLAREKVLTRNVPAVELLGATTVLCVDKTGTLTSNRMAVRRLWTETTSYDSANNDKQPLAEALHPILEFAVLASHRRAFDPMESAIVESGQRLLAKTEHLHSDWKLVEDYPLSPEMLAMSRVWQSPDQSELMIAAKGAPEAIIDLCHMEQARHRLIATQVEAMAGAGLRVLGVARAVFAAQPLPDNQHDFIFEFLGLIALEDPLRPDVPRAIAECQAAGIRVVMITGDHPATALAIARQAGLIVDSGVMTGAELAELNDDALKTRLAATNIFCRVQPEQKLRLVQAFRARGEVVAMTGDGVNDAPALKAAHIGVAMGARGTDVAREAAALVLLNDDFASLVTAVRYGRRVFANLRKAVVFVVAVHVPIVGLSLLPVMLGWPMLLMPIHILFLQLIIDPACSVIFEAEPLEADAMNSPPRAADAHLFDASVLVRGLWQGSGLLALLLAVYALARAHSHSDEIARAMTFVVLVLSDLALIFANRRWSKRASLLDASGANKPFMLIALAAIVLLACGLFIPAISRLFAFSTPTPVMLLAGIGAAGVSWLWFEGVKRML
ncbi:MAG: cation-translocating P-type ATPase, partial [Burkholderiales bacterium]|nr:cation-translocating P-type ATPase [Burkholderiales bacterium]